MITLPKEWAERVGLKKNDPVWLQPHPDGTMIIHPQSEMTSNETTKVLEIESDIDRNLLYRQLVGAYIAGHDRIVGQRQLRCLFGGGVQLDVVLGQLVEGVEKRPVFEPVFLIFEGQFPFEIAGLLRLFRKGGFQGL